MSLSRTIDRLARVVRIEARRNPEFAARLEAVFAAHVSRAPAASFGLEVEAILDKEVADDAPALRAELPNPVALVARDGAGALAASLEQARLDRRELLAFIAEHHLDPAGEADGLTDQELIPHLVAQAARRAERDRKLFDY